jgi:hypothetical protein
MMDKLSLKRFATDTYNRQQYNIVLGLIQIAVNRLISGFLFPINSYSSNTNLTDADSIVLVNAAGGAVTITLPDAFASEKKMFRVKKIDASANAVTVVPQGSSLIDGAASKSTTTQWVSYTYTAYDGNWYIV